MALFRAQVGRRRRNLAIHIYINVVAYILAFVNGAKPGQAPFTKDLIVGIGAIADGQTVMSVIKLARALVAF